jgi:hypothetical protein
MKTRQCAGKNSEPQGGLYLLAAVIFAVLYGIPLLTSLMAGTPH